MIPYAGILWALRERSYFLGDQWVWFENIQAGREPLYTEPLAAVAWYRFADLLRLIHAPLDPAVLGILSVVCGIVSAVLAWGIAGQLAGSGARRITTFVLLLALGTVQLYCGHIESYPIVSVFLLLYIYLGLRLARGAVSPLLVGIALGAAVSSHLLLLYLAPSYFLLISQVRSSRLARAGLFVLPFALVAAALSAFGFRLQDLARPFLTLHTSMRVGGGQQSGWLPALSPWPALDLGNLVLLVMPVPALILATRLVRRSWSPWGPRPATRFLAAAAAPGLLAALALLVAGTLAQDWDLLAMAIRARDEPGSWRSPLGPPSLSSWSTRASRRECGGFRS